MPVHRRGLGDLSDVPVTRIEEADVEQESSSSSLSKPLLDHETGLSLRPEQPDQNGVDNGTAEGQQAAKVERERFITTILINLSAIMERTDEQLLPAVYRFVGASFQVAPCSLVIIQLYIGSWSLEVQARPMYIVWLLPPGYNVAQPISPC